MTAVTVAAPVAPRRVRTRPPLTQLAAPALASAVAAIAAVDVLFRWFLPLTGSLGFWLSAYAAFLLVYAGVVALTTGSREAMKDRVATVVLASAGLLMLTVVVLVVGFTAVRGWGALRHAGFFVHTTAETGPQDPLKSGGIYAAAVGTLEQVLIATLVSVPLALGTALYLSETDGRARKAVRIVVETMTAIPSILAGLFIFAIVILTFGFQRSGLGAALALSVEMLPVVARASDVVLRLVPSGLREASYALGASRWETVKRVVLPTARAGLVTAVLLGIARVVGETAPVLLVAGFTSELNYNPTSGPQLSLPLFVFTYVKFPIDNAITRAFGAAFTLVVIVLVLFVIARVLGNRQPGQRWLRRVR
ncbi:MAG TPA: phosphate ABC transporter permease PstA [Mycobacteriales bacterium]|nr:phosphate ABC transporter permease PstA [Mycobacteriales bacterium]